MDESQMPFNPLQQVQQGIALNQQAVQQPNPFQAIANPPPAPLNNEAYTAALTPEQQQVQQALQSGTYAQQAGSPADVMGAAQSMEKQVGTIAPTPLSETDFVPAEQQAPKSQGKSAESNYESQLRSAFKMQEQGIAAAAKAASQKAEAQSAELDAQAAKDIERANKIEQMQFKSEQAAKDQTTKLENMANEISSFKFSEGKIDPNNFWSSRSTGDKVMAGIAIALSGLGQGHLAQAGIKSDNSAMTIINNAIDNDLKAQRDNLAMTLEREKSKVSNMKAGADINQNLLSEVHKQFDDSMQAEQATRYLMLDQAERKLKSIASKYDSPDVLAKRDILLGELQQKKATSLYDVQKIAGQKAMLQGTAESGNYRDLNPEQVNALGKDYAERYVGGYGFSYNKDQAQKFNEVRATIEPAISGADRILQLSKDFNRVTDFKKRAAIQSEMKALAGQLRIPLTGPGAMTEKEFDRLMDTIGDPTSLTSISSLSRKKLETVKSKLQTDLNTSARQYGLTPKQGSATLGFKPRN